ncbi:MAG: dihydroorotate dehydrogenase electron transfer subunit [Bacteroidetes bacterium]|nr:dihydroorotate dehydrogenase electron transfer subunit [Bacteroidota bacterium]
MLSTTAHIIGKNKISETLYILMLECPAITRSAKAGQFVMIRVNSHSIEPLLRRPFSISWIDGDYFEILLQVVGGGTRKLSEKDIGDEVEVLGPLGNSFRIDNTFETAILVAGGVGVAPFPILTKELRERGKEVQTFIGARTKSQLYTQHLVNCSVSTDDGTEGFHGTVVDNVRAYLENTEMQKLKLFACGPTPMLKALGVLVHHKKLNCEVSLETEMACGFGICQGCVVQLKDSNKGYALACKDGPNFFIDEIVL